MAASHGVDRDRRRQDPSQQEDRLHAAASELQGDADYAYRMAVEPPAGRLD